MSHPLDVSVMSVQRSLLVTAHFSAQSERNLAYRDRIFFFNPCKSLPIGGKNKKGGLIGQILTVSNLVFITEMKQTVLLHSCFVGTFL